MDDSLRRDKRTRTLPIIFIYQFLTEQHVHFLRYLTYSDDYIPISYRTARALSTIPYVLRRLYTNFFTNSQHVPGIHLRYTYQGTIRLLIHNNQPTLLLHAFFFFSIFSTTRIPYARRVHLLQPPLFQHKTLYLILALFFAFARFA
jgi:hypothetical protein